MVVKKKIQNSIISTKKCPVPLEVLGTYVILALSANSMMVGFAPGSELQSRD